MLPRTAPRCTTPRPPRPAPPAPPRGPPRPGGPGARVLDGGGAAGGGLQGGLGLARVCLAGLGEVALVPSTLEGLPCPEVQVTTDQPVLACMASQYAGWQVAVDKFFAMGSG